MPPAFDLIRGALIAALGTGGQIGVRGRMVACVWEPAAGVSVALATDGTTLRLGAIAGDHRDAWAVDDPLTAAREAQAWVREHGRAG